MKKDMTEDVKELFDAIREHRDNAVENNQFEVTKYTDWITMVESLQQYVYTTGNKLEIKDDPRRLRIGFIDPVTNKWFVIGIANLKRSQMVMSPKYAEILRLALQTEDGKSGLLALINEFRGE